MIGLVDVLVSLTFSNNANPCISHSTTVPPYPVVGVVPPRTKSPPVSSPESCTIASYVTLRKSKKTDSSRSVGRPTNCTSATYIFTSTSSITLNTFYKLYR